MRRIRLGNRYGVQWAAIAAALAIAGPACAERGEPAGDHQGGPAATAPVGDPSTGMSAHARHLEPASRRLPPLAPLPARLPMNAEDTGRFNVLKPKEMIVNPAPLPQGPLDTQLHLRQQDYLARWRQQETAMAGASAVAVEQARADLKAKVVGQ